MTFTDEEIAVIRAGLVALHTHQVSQGNLPDPKLVALLDRLNPDNAAPDAAPEA
jgi:hypothetical protein